MATATNSRRDLYASSEPRPKDSAKKRSASPFKKSPLHKNSTKRPKKELSQEEISLLTYQSISLLLDAARMLDEAEKKAAAKAAPTTKPVVRPPVKITPRPISVAPAPIPVVAPQIPPRSPAKLICDDTQSTTSSIAAASALTLLTESPPRPTVAVPEPVAARPTQVVTQTTKVTRIPYYSPAYRVVQAVPHPGPPTKVVAPIAREIPVPYQAPLYTAVPTAAVVPPMISPSVPLLRPVANPPHPDTLVPMMHRPITALPIPAELADIAVPVAPRSVPSMPRKVNATRRPQKSHLPPATKKKGKTASQIALDKEREMNYGYPDECRTRVPNAVRRYHARKEKMEKMREQSFFTDYYWK